ncbi:20526_t:CDS:2, partial [Entrophospora sp. SA101]
SDLIELHFPTYASAVFAESSLKTKNWNAKSRTWLLETVFHFYIIGKEYDSYTLIFVDPGQLWWLKDFLRLRPQDNSYLASLKNLLLKKLKDDGWDEKIKNHLYEIIKKEGIDNVNIDKLEETLVIFGR